MQDEEEVRHDMVDQEETQEETVDSTDAAAEPEQDVETEDKTDDEGGSEDDGVEKPQGKKEKPWYKYRIEREKAKVDELQRRLDEFERRQNQPSGSNEPKPDDFLTNAEYQRALARFEAEQVYGRQREEQNKHYQQQMQHQQQMQSWKSKIDDYVTRTGKQDYAQVVSNAEVDLDGEKVQGLMESEYGPDIAYALASDPDKAWKVSQMTPKQFERFVIREEAKIELGSNTTPSTSNARPSVSKAPAPVTPTGKGTKSSSNTLDDYVKQRRAEINRL